MRRIVYSYDDYPCELSIERRADGDVELTISKDDGINLFFVIEKEEVASVAKDIQG